MRSEPKLSCNRLTEYGSTRALLRCVAAAARDRTIDHVKAGTANQDAGNGWKMIEARS